MSQKRWSIAFAPAGEGTYQVTVRRSGSVHRFTTALPPDISDLWQAPQGTATPTRSFRSNPAALAPEARFFQAADLPTLKDIGERVLASLFDLGGDGEGIKIVGALEDRIADNEGVELEVDLSQTAELSGIPWESLYLRSHDRFLGIGTTSNIVRRLDAQSDLPPPVDKPIRLLAVTANPTDNLDTSAELGNIERRIAELVAAGSDDFVIEVLKDARRDDFRRKVNEWKPHVIHYIGHSAFDGTEGHLYFESETEGKSDKVSAETLRNMLLNNRPWLVVLNSCQSGQTSRDAPMAGVAQNLLQRLNVPFVVAMQQPVSDDAAINFSQDFYTALTAGETIASAVTIGRCAIANDADVRTQVELITPALYTSGEVERIAFADPPVAPAPAMAPAAAPPAASEEAGEKKKTLLGLTNAKLGAVLVLLTTIGGILTQADTILGVFDKWGEAPARSDRQAGPAGPEQARAATAEPGTITSVAPAAPEIALPAPVPARGPADGLAPEAEAQPVPVPVRRTTPARVGASAALPGSARSLPHPPAVSQAAAPPTQQTFAVAAMPAAVSERDLASDGAADPTAGQDTASAAPRVVRVRRVAVRSEGFERPGAAAPITELGGGSTGLPEAYRTEAVMPDQDYGPIFAAETGVRDPVICDGLARTVHFDLGSATPIAADRARLESLARQLACPSSDLVVAGFADRSGSAQGNLALSFERAKTIVAALGQPLAAHLVPAYANAYAEDFPVVETADGVEEPANRRAEIYLGHKCPGGSEIIQSVAPGADYVPMPGARPWGADGSGFPLVVALNTRAIADPIDDATAENLRAVAAAAARDLNAPLGAVFPVVVGDKCLAPGETDRIDIHY